MTLQRMVIVEAIVLVVMFVVLLSLGHAAECSPEKGSGAHWSWRSIDGKRCWYQGQLGLDKAKLNWVKLTTPPSSRVLPAKSLDELTPYDDIAPLRVKPMADWSRWDYSAFQRLLESHGRNRLRQIEQQEEVLRLLREQAEGG